ncbi:hypothetical protein QRE62_03420 (plasmid) [Bacillus mycoides]|uniref:Uncharacterized protein n=1 Tax=Bacillus mycoides TaxID=1405 RepID=A0A1S9SQD6_BACMY|nr:MULTISPECIES: hypothetical protein [Bacillus]MDI6534979.1 hypothetical protein [Bacillus mycoides]OOQ99957.1 hypothetical protein BW900_31380 [Bacillus mycoides]RAN71150.1 hypothetical protein B5P40_08900 [Bacillus sp. SRB_8]WJE61787.1 hypothetical protein QRE64_30635 [Bacillus mycoides]WJE67735.1 hypothetical protein QRE63_32605 [Bacillus mycoides]
MGKKRIVFLFLGFLILFVVFWYSKGYSDKYIQWGDTVKSVDTNILERNNIPYKVKNNKVYIPEDAFNKAIMCCS